jgi:hypothetical protein
MSISVTMMRILLTDIAESDLSSDIPEHLLLAKLGLSATGIHGGRLFDSIDIPRFLFITLLVACIVFMSAPCMEVDCMQM